MLKIHLCSSVLCSVLCSLCCVRPRLRGDEPSLAAGLHLKDVDVAYIHIWHVLLTRDAPMYISGGYACHEKRHAVNCCILRIHTIHN